MQAQQDVERTKAASLPRKSQEEIEQWLVQHLRSRRGLLGSDDITGREFGSLGLDSLELEELAVELGSWLGRELPQSLRAARLTVAGLAQQIAVVPAPPLPAPRVAESGRHPFTEWVNPYLGDLLQRLCLGKTFVRGQGCEVFDDKGRRYLDFIAAYGALPFGHNPDEIWDALLRARAEQEPGFIQPSMLRAAGELGRQLIAIAPAGLRYVTFTNSGTEAVEAAIKLCRVATARLAILTTDGSFHGKTLGALSATGNKKYHQGFGVPLPLFDRIPFGDAAALAARLAERPGHYAAFLVEPIQGEGGIVQPPPGYLREIRQICSQAGVLLVFDEIQTGLGRTGAMFAADHEGVTPDVLTVAKALGGGLLPIGACLSSAAAFTEDFALKHSSTFAGNALACRVGLAALERLQRDGGALLQQVAANGRWLKAQLEELRSRYPRVLREVRGRGYMLGLRLSPPEGDRSSLLAVASEQGGFAPLFASYLLNVEGVRLAPTLNGADVLRIEPPLTATAEECVQVAAAIERTLAVFHDGDVGRILGSILEGRELPAARGVVCVEPPSVPMPQPEDARFAFILHPIELASYLEFEPSLASVGARLEEAVACLHGMGKPAVVSQTRVVGHDDCAAWGEFIVLGRTAKELMALSLKDAASEVGAAVDLARERGARLVGLGAFTSVVTQGGLALGERGVALTSGNAYTALSAQEGSRLALRRLGHDGPPTVAIVGATGAIGQAVALLWAEEASRLILLGNRNRSKEHVRERLFGVAARCCQHLLRLAQCGAAPSGPLAQRVIASGVSADAPIDELRALVERLQRNHGLFLFSQEPESLLQLAELVVVATSATDQIISASCLRPGAVICDVSRPRNIAPEVAADRQDVLVIDGGVIEVPNRPYLGRFGLEQGLAYACMAETFMLALDKRYTSMSLGAELRSEDLVLLRGLAARHRFKVAALRSFQRLLTEDDFTQRLDARRGTAKRRSA